MYAVYLLFLDLQCHFLDPCLIHPRSEEHFIPDHFHRVALVNNIAPSAVRESYSLRQCSPLPFVRVEITFRQTNVPSQSKFGLLKPAEGTSYNRECSLSHTTGLTLHLLDQGHSLLVQSDEVETERNCVVGHDQGNPRKGLQELD